MKVYHLPANIASLMSHNVRAERSIGIDARGLTFDWSWRVANEGLDVIPERKPPMRWLLKVWAIMRAIRGIFWADVVHWYGATPLLGLERLVWKPKVHTWCGAECRIPEMEADNPYFKEAEYEEQHKKAFGNIRRFSGYFSIAENPSAQQYTKGCYIGRGIIPTEGKSIDDGFILHVGSQPGTKGTDLVEPILKKTGVLYVIAKTMPREVLQQFIKECSVFVGQFRLGDIGMAEIEAMWAGKPVLAYIKPHCLEMYPEGFPVVVCTVYKLEEELSRLLTDKEYRREVGKRSFEYAQKQFDAVTLAKKRKAIYEEVIRGRS